METWRKRMQHRITIYAIVFYVMLLFIPFVMADTQNSHPADMSVFGLHPELVKGAFYLLLLVVGFFLTKTLIKVDKNQSTLFDNQRKLAVTLASLVTAHNINHKQNIDIPSLSDSAE